ncbi:MAG TPA: DNA N-6-adenine-methyltransferase [Cyanophyceae cyanobacterium]
MPTLLKIEKKIGEYIIVVEGDEDSAIAKVETESGAVILNSAYKSVEGKILDHEYIMDATEVAEHAALEAYHQAVGTTDGLTDINSLATHPFNELIYGEEEVEDLVELLSKEDGQIFQVTINPKGQILAGNRRIKAGIEINRQLAAQGKPPKFENIPAKVLAFASPEAELKYMVLHNQGRKKTKQQIAEEVNALIALAESPAIPIDTRISSQELIGQIEKDLGVSRATAFNAKEALKQANKIKDPLFKEQIKGFIVDVPNKARQLLEANPPRSAGLKKEDYQKKLLEHIEENPGDSVKVAIAKVNATIIPKEESDILKQMREKGDNPNDNRKTPKEIVELGSDVLGVMDIDAFAMASDPDWIPAAKCYTVFDDAWKQEFEGNVFANPPFSKASEAIALMDKHIRNGGIKKLFLILPSGVLSTKNFHSFVKDHNPCVYLPSKRLAFEPGELLLAEKGNVTTDSNREPSVIVFYSTSVEDYTIMVEATTGKGWCGRQYTPTNPYQLFSEINDLKWTETQTGEESSFYGTPIAVVREGKKFSALMNGEAIATFSSIDVAKKIAVMEAIASFSL